MSLEARRAAHQLGLSRMLSARRVALIGGRSLALTVEGLRANGFAGAIDIVNPKEREIAGISCVPAVSDLCESPDAAFVAVNRRLTVEAVRALARIGAAGALCHAAGFSEMGEAGRALESELLDAADDMAIIGPNSNGLVNRLDGLSLWPVADDRTDRVERGVALVAQSGGVASMFLRDRRGVRPAIVVSTGNQAQLDPADWLAVLGADPRITAVGLFLEDPGDPIALSRAAEAARKRSLPVVVLKSGRSALGAEMAATHTGALAGEDDLFDALCRRCGLIRVSALSAFAETLKALDIWGPLPGRRIAVVTASGAARALVADAASAGGLVLPAPSAEVAARLRPQLPEFAHVSNPLDHNAAYVGMTHLSMENEPALQACFETFLQDRYDVALLHSDWNEQGPTGSPSSRAWIKAAKAAGTRGGVLCLMPENMSEEMQSLCRDGGQVALQGLEEGLAAIAASAAPLPPGPVDLPYTVTLASGRRIVDEWESKSLLEAAGVPFPRRRRLAPDAVADVSDLSGPLALKVISARLSHKAAVGGVALHLLGADAVESARKRMVAVLGASGVAADGFLLEEMVTGSVAELLVGVKVSPVYGPALIVGAGGVATEKHQDATAVLLPAGEAEIADAFGRLRVAPLIPVAVMPQLVALASRVAAFALAQSGRLSALDINPVIVTGDGRAIAVDALIEEAT